jgi:hypothetical protein
MTTPNTATVTSGTGTADRRLRIRDLVVMGGSAVLLVSAFLPFWSYYRDETTTTWHWGTSATLLLGFGAGVAAGVLVAVGRLTPGGDVAPRLGLGLDQLTGVLAVVSFLELAFSGLGSGLDSAVGLWTGLLGAVALLVGTVVAHVVPALSAPVGGGAAAHGPFWFSVAVPTPVHDPATGAPRANLQPGRWYLATADHGTAWAVSDQEFGSAVLHDLRAAQRA